MANVEIYISHYREDGAVVDEETLIQTVPFSPDEDPVLTNPKIKHEMGKAESMDFGLEILSPYYDAFMQMKTLIRVKYFGQTIFYGRAISIDKTFWGTRTVHCEGAFAFLMDSHQIGTKEESRPEITVWEYLNNIIDQHNSDVDEDKQFVLGEVPGNYKTTPSDQQVEIPTDRAKQQFGSTSWNNSMNRVEDLLNDFGGYWRTRYDDETGTVYLDWLDKYFYGENTQNIEITNNLIDLSGPTEVENLFTVLIPIGKNNSENVYISDYWPVASSGHALVEYIEVPELATEGLYTDAELNVDYHRKEDYQNAISQYGRIWKIVNFENANTPEKLFNYAKDWIKNNYTPELTQWSVSALDIRIVDATSRALYCGDKVALKHPEVDQTYGGLTIISAEYDLYSPDHNRYNIGLPNQILNAAYGVKAKQATSGKGGGGGGGGGGASNQNTNDIETPEETRARLKSELRSNYISKTDFNKDIQYDEPSVFLAYNTDGSAKTREEATAAWQEYKKILDTFTPEQKAQAEELAKARSQETGMPISWWSPDVVVEISPKARTMWSDWRSGFRTIAQDPVNGYGMSEQEIDQLLNEKSGTSILAALVTDDGEWSDFAIRNGVDQREGADNLKQQAINTRKIYNGEESTGFFSFLRAAQDTVTGGFGIDIPGWMQSFTNFDSVTGELTNMLSGMGGDWNMTSVEDTLTGALAKVQEFLGGEFSFSDLIDGSTGKIKESAMDLLNGIFTGWFGEDGEKEANIQTTTFQMNANRSKTNLLLGKDEADDWLVKMNEPLKWIDDKGVERTVPPGTIDASDFAMLKAATGKNIPSLSSKFIVTDTLIAGCAKIEDLEVTNATIASLNSKVASIDKIISTEIETRVLDALNTSTATMSVYALHIRASEFRFNNSQISKNSATLPDGTVINYLSY